MSQSYTEISKSEFFRLTTPSNRVMPTDNWEDSPISYKSINHKLILKERVQIPRGHVILSLIFNNCIFFIKRLI